MRARPGLFVTLLAASSSCGQGPSVVAGDGGDGSTPMDLACALEPPLKLWMDYCLPGPPSDNYCFRATDPGI